MFARHRVELARLGLVGNFVEPVAVFEAQKILQRMADVAAKYAVGLGVGDVKLADRCHEPIGEHVQRGSLEMGNEKEQEMLMTKTAKETAIRVHKKVILGLSDDDEGMSGAHETRACELFAKTGIAIAVVAEALLELAEVALRIGKFRGGAGLVADPHAD